MSLIDLPNDIWFEISQQLDLAALVALSRTCRVFRRTTEYWRFREITIKDRSRYGTGPESFNAITKAHALFNAFRTTPSLRQHVERVSLTATFCNQSWSEEQRCEVSRMAKENSKNFILTEPDKLDLQVDIALFGLHLNMPMLGTVLDLPRLRELELRFYGGVFVRTEPSWLNARRTRCPSLKSLTVIKSWFTDELALWLFTMAPNVHDINFDLTCTSEGSYKYPPYTWKNDQKWLKWSNIGHHLRNCLASDPPALKSLSLHGYCESNDDGSGPFQGHANTVDAEGKAPDWGIEGNLQSLQQFRCLETLSVSVEVLLGSVDSEPTPLAQVLPPSIKRLLFPSGYEDLIPNWGYPEISRVILDYLESEVSENLRHLTLDFGYIYESDDEFVMRIKKVCRERAIELELLEYGEVSKN